MKKIKVLYTITDLGKGGAERFLLDLTHELENFDCIEYKIAVCNNEVKYDEFIEHPKTVFINYQPFSFKKKNENQKYSQLLDEFQPDIVHSNRFLGEFVTAYDVRPNIQYICHGHDNMIQFHPLKLQEYGKKDNLLKAFEYHFLKKQKYAKVPTHFIANSKDTLDFYKQVLPKNQKQNVHFIPLGFDFERFYRKRENYLSNSKLKLLNVGSYQPKKNQIFALEIAEKLKEQGIDFELNLIGHGAEYDYISTQIKEKELSNHVFQQGLQSNVEKWYQAADIYLHTAYYEPFGLVFLEAMATGLPIITLDGKGNRDIIEHDKNGYLFYEQNAQVFANKIIELSTHPEKYCTISKYAQEFAKKYDVKERTKELVEFYQFLLKKE